MRIPLVLACVLLGCTTKAPSAEVDAGPTAEPPVCEAPNTVCGDTCSALETDDANCGACGSACPADQACAGGACYARACGSMNCAGSQVCVDQVCLDRACFGVICPADQACAGGACVARDCAAQSCDPSQVCVSEACVEAACVGVACPAGLTCARGLCVSDTCSNGVKDGTETDGDCGGICSPCADGRACAQTSDCASRSCSGNLCATSTCSDGVRNQDEAAIDCGGSCAKCPVSSACNVGGDCQSGVCKAGRCAQPNCTDGAKNNQETGLDCGGGTCPACSNGQPCIGGTDCVSTLCAASKCVAPTCQNGTKDNGETDLDCGGPCAGCAATRSCLAGPDCQSGVCDTLKKCAAPSCADTVKNGFETDKDCGGNCSPCAPGLKCLLPVDCGSKVCAANICRAANCTDTVVNGGESDQDCGGSTPCPRCAQGMVCSLPGDCASGQCVSNKCTQVPLFSTPVALSAGTSPRDVAVGDFDEDGKQDVVVANSGSFDVTVNFGVGDGTFTAIPALAVSGSGAGPATLAVADVSGDGKKDILIGRAMSGPGGWGGCRLTVIRNAGTRNFLASADFDHYTGSWNGCGAGLAVGTFNGDAYLDVAVGDEEFGNYVSGSDDRGGYYWLGQADGGFGSSKELPLAGPWMAAADFNRDSFVDVVGHSVKRGNASVFLSTATGPAAAAAPVFGVSAGPGCVTTGLVNNDVNPDIVVAAGTANRVSVAFGLGTGNFLAPATYAVNAPYGVALADVDGDSLVDLVVGSGGIAVLLGTPTATFGAAAYYQSTALGAVKRIAIGDFNGDGNPDVAAVAGTKAWVLLNVAP